ncbi:MAG: hypothetical protein ACJ796_14165 [Gemmatimonadaceae bacterium]
MISLDRWTARTLLAVASAASPAAAQVAGQSPQFRAIEVHVHERRLDGRQNPRFTPYSDADRWLIVDSVHAGGAAGMRMVFSTIDEHSDSRATVVLAPNGRVVRVTVSSPEQRDTFPLLTGSRIGDARLDLIDPWTDRLTLPATYAWDLTFTFRPARLRMGARWVDSIALTADSAGEHQGVAGVRVSVIVGDTTISGEHLWIVRDSAAIRVDERELTDDVSSGADIAFTRATNGVVIGRMIFDPRRGLLRMRDDTTRLTGIAELRYPDGRVFRKPARDEIERHLVSYTARGYKARQDSIEREETRHRSGGVVIVATDSGDARVARGDTATRDSLVRAWLATSDPNEWTDIYDRLHLWAGQDTAFIQRLDRLREEQGDSAYMLRGLAAGPYNDSSTAPIDTATMRDLIRVMQDPGLPFAFGVDPAGFYDDVVRGLTARPPAAIADSSHWACTRAACQMLANQWRTATEPRLRQLGLVTHFVLDPRTWTDTLLARARADSALFRGALALARGVAATWPSATHASIPPPDADFHAWLDWMNGENAASRRWRARAKIPQTMASSPLRFDEGHATALRFTIARTGRDLVGELRRKLVAARSDSATLVYEYMLVGLGELHPSPDRVAAHFRSSSAARRTLGARELKSLFTGHVSPADSALATLLQDQLIATALGRGKRWRALNPVFNNAMPSREVSAEKTLLLADSLTPAVRAKWAPFVAVISAKDWEAQDVHVGGTLFVLSGVARVGPFARIAIKSEGRVARPKEQAPWLYYAETTYYLMQLGSEWVIVGMDSWIT